MSAMKLIYAIKAITAQQCFQKGPQMRGRPTPYTPIMKIAKMMFKLIWYQIRSAPGLTHKATPGT